MDKNINKNMYLKVFIGLLLLTGLTLVQPFVVDLHLTNTLIVQMFISFIKASLIVLYYMHLKYEARLFRGLFMILVVTLVIVFSIMIVDMVFRESVNDAYNVWSAK